MSFCVHLLSLSACDAMRLTGYHLSQSELAPYRQISCQRVNLDNIATDSGIVPAQPEWFHFFSRSAHVARLLLFFI
jgi:D-alanyl-D-alanine dipeptidase